MLIDLAAIRGAAEKHKNNHWLMANVANPANLANSKPENPGELAKLATLARLAISHGVTSAPHEEAKTVPRFSVEAPWRAADSAFQDHYWRCPECKAAGRASAPLCPRGQSLHDTYQAA